MGIHSNSNMFFQKLTQKNRQRKPTLPETKIAPEKVVVGRLLSFWGPAHFQGPTVSFREGQLSKVTVPALCLQAKSAAGLTKVGITHSPTEPGGFVKNVTCPKFNSSPLKSYHPKKEGIVFQPRFFPGTSL